MRVHEHLLSRADLSRADRDRAQHALALDFLKAGLLDRAEDALRRLEGTPFEAQARVALLAIYERSRDWPQALAITQKMQDAHQGDFSARQAHFLCEQALSKSAQGDLSGAHELFDQAVKTAPHAARARIELARLAQRKGDSREALNILLALADASPTALPLAAALLVEVGTAAGESAKVLQLLTQRYEQMPSLDLLEGIVSLDSALGHTAESRAWYVKHLEHEPSLVAAAKWLATEKLEHEEFHPQVQRALDQAAKPLTRYRCAACGFEARQHFWQCPGCQTWDSYPTRRVEEL